MVQCTRELLEVLEVLTPVLLELSLIITVIYDIILFILFVLVITTQYYIINPKILFYFNIYFIINVFKILITQTI